MQASEDVDEGQPDISGNVDVLEENVSLEQVTSSKTLDCISFMKPFSHRKANFVLMLKVLDMLFCVTCAFST